METLIFITELIIWIHLMRIMREVRKGNKDQLEIKTRLHWMKESIGSIKDILGWGKKQLDKDAKKNK